MLLFFWNFSFWRFETERVKLQAIFFKEKPPDDRFCRSQRQALREKCPYLEFFWSVFSHSRTEWYISPHSVQMRENTDQENSEYGLFLRSEDCF